MPAGSLTRRRTILAPGAVWTPLSVPNLQVWLDANYYTGIVADGAAIPVGTNWVDRSASWDAHPHGGLTFRASVIGGLPAVQFGGVDGYFDMLQRTGITFQTRIYIAAVVKTGASVTANRTFFSKGNNSADPDYIFQYGFVSAGLAFYNGTTWVSGSASVLAANTAYVVELFWDGANMTFSVTGTTTGTPAYSGTLQTSSDMLYIGMQGSTPTNQYDGHLAELLLVGNGVADGSGQISTSDRASIRSYLRSKYGL